MTVATVPLKRSLGLAAVVALVVGDMLGSGIFVTPGELAAVAQRPWQVYFIWTLSGVITLCGALTLAELCTLLPRAGSTYHAIRDGYGAFWGFLFVWMQLWVAGPGSVASLAIALGTFLGQAGGVFTMFSPVVWGALAIALYVLINLAGVEWGGRTQVLLTTVKVAGVLALIVGGLFIAAPAAPTPDVAAPSAGGLAGFVRFTGLGIALVLFTYDGWIDASHVAGEVRNPTRDFPRALGLGVAAVSVLYLLVNLAFLRVVSLPGMSAAPSTVAARVATAAYGTQGGALLNALMTISFFGALGGLVMTLPRLFYTVAADYTTTGPALPRRFFDTLSHVSARNGVPAGAVIFTGVTSIAALAFFGSFSRLVNFLVVPMQLANVLMVTAVFRLRRRARDAGAYRTPGYPVTPLIYAVVMIGFLVSALVYQPVDTLIGLGIAVTGAPVYLWLRRGNS